MFINDWEGIVQREGGGMFIVTNEAVRESDEETGEIYYFLV